MTRRVLIVGSGIVGTCVAQWLSQFPELSISVLERNDGLSCGSTSLAPGFVGLYNESAVLGQFAQQSAKWYEKHCSAAFSRTGGVEIATSEDGVEQLVRRVEGALAAGFRAKLLPRNVSLRAVAPFVHETEVEAAAFFADDGSANVVPLVRSLRDDALRRHVQFRSCQEVIGIEHIGGQIAVTTTDDSTHSCDELVLAGGIWGSHLAGLVGLDLPIVPVAHPYVYGPVGDGGRGGPFVRWLENHVYARMHRGRRLGIGSYNHQPVPIAYEDLGPTAEVAWSNQFTAVINEAQTLLNESARFEPVQKVNGVFAMTPDNLPFVGPHPSRSGVWIAQGLWITHAAGAAAAMGSAIATGSSLPSQLAVSRFDGQRRDELHGAALRLYRDIYATRPVPDGIN